MSHGSYVIWPADNNGVVVPDSIQGERNIVSDKSVDIYFAIPNAVQPPPKDQLELQQNIEKVFRVVQLLYGQSAAGGGQKSKSNFRSYYVRVFRLAQLGLEGQSALPDVAKVALAAVSADLVDDEAVRIKNGHLKHLGWTALAGSLPFLVLYGVIQLAPAGWDLSHLLSKLNVAPPVLANFMLLWIGCFTGVWLSYGVRKNTITISDLIRTDADYLVPVIRLLFAGTLTMILGLGFVLGAVELKVGRYAVTDIGSNSILAYLVGALCGTSELLLPSIVAKRSAEFLSTLR